MNNFCRVVLEKQQEMWKRVGISGPYRAEAFILRNADVEAEGVKCPADIKRGTPRQCFSNAAALSHRPGLDYCEGYACKVEIEFPFLHAWCLNRTTGLIVDNTLDNPELFHYLGIKVPLKMLVRELMRNQVYGLLDTGLGYNQKFMKRFEERKRLRTTPKSV